MTKMSRLTPANILEAPHPIFSRPASTPLLLDRLNAALDFLKPYFQNQENEHLRVLYLNTDRLFCGMKAWSGKNDFIELPIRQIISYALSSEAAGIILAHNHPSGDPYPSHDDIKSTRILSRICNAIDIKMLDHVIFSGNKSTSMRDLRLI